MNVSDACYSSKRWGGQSHQNGCSNQYRYQFFLPFFLPFLYPFFDPTNPGASVAGTAAGWAGMPHSVTFKLELENYTNEHLKVFSIFFLGISWFCRFTKVKTSVDTSEILRLISVQQRKRLWVATKCQTQPLVRDGSYYQNGKIPNGLCPPPLPSYLEIMLQFLLENH